MEEKSKLPLITLTTDFGSKDGFVGIMKGVMLTICPTVQIVDISHEILPHDIRSAAFVIAQSYAYFPENTLHVVIVDPGVGGDRPILYVEAGTYRFLVPDNGVLQYILQWEKLSRVIQVTNPDFFLPEQSHTFQGRDIFAPVAAHLAGGLAPARLGEVVNDFQISLPPQPVVTDGGTNGEIIYIDHFGNLISNITREYLHEVQKKKKPYRVLLADEKISEISPTFSDKPFGNLLAYVDSSNYLAVAIAGQNAAQKLGVAVGDRIELRLE